MSRKLLTVFFLTASTGGVWAADVQGQGTVSRVWNNPASWDTGNVPTTADKAVLIWATYQTVRNFLLIGLSGKTLSNIFRW